MDRTRAHAFSLAQALADAVGSDARIVHRTPLGGGDISQVERLETTAGRFILKAHASPPDGLFHAEADGHRAIRASSTSLRTPAVVAVSDGFIILEDLGAGHATGHFDEAFGRGLAELHEATAPAFGFHRETFCGTTTQPNGWTGDWIAFYGQARLGHQLALATRSGRLGAEDANRVERLIDGLDALITPPAAGASLIHGDLWSGNVHVTADGTPALIDPSVYFGHREAELGMMTLFGSFSPTVYAAYEEMARLERGWRERNPLYQLYHLMNHLNLFGGGYRAQVMAVVKRFE